jgi:multidrug efflux pump subunit AcrB
VTRFNLSEWALKHRAFVWYLMLAALVGGVLSYQNLGREEDPPFTIKTMIIQANWPGATVDEMINQVTDRIERKLEELGNLDFTNSYTSPGQTTVFVNLHENVRGPEIRATWISVRNKIADIQAELPSGVRGPFFNDQFGDVYGIIYAFTADGLSFRQLRDYAEQARAEILKIPSAGKVDLIGTQDEVIYLDVSTKEIAGLGLDWQQVIQSLQAQNAVAPSGTVQAGPERVSLRVSGQYASEDALRAVNLRINDRFFRLADIATITRSYRQPPQPMFRFNGQPAIGLAIGMKPNGNILEFGDDARARMAQIIGELPIGVGIHLVSEQPEVVREAVGGFTKALFEAIVIVLVVSFVSLGLRAGLVVACAIPLVLAATFVFMEYAGFTLQRISLGALIIALGLLVDDAMISVEMMVAKREEGEDLDKAATFAYTSTAFPMLTGTLVTVAGFVPIGLNSFGRRIYVHLVCRDRVFAADLLGGRGAVHPAARRDHAAEDRGRPHRRTKPVARKFQYAAARRDAAAVAHHRPHSHIVRCVGLRPAVCPAAVLPRLGPAGAAGRHDAAAEQLDRRNQDADGPVRSRIGRRPRHRTVEFLCGTGRRPVLFAAR